MYALEVDDLYSILIAEDELLVRMGIASSVRWSQMDMRVVAETVDGLSAWQAFEKLHPDIVIADIRMPKLNGVDLLRRIREVDPDCAVIMVTNVEHEPTLNEVRALGVVDILLKASMNPTDIHAAVERARDQLMQKQRSGNAEPIYGNDVWRLFVRGALNGSAEQPLSRKGLFLPDGFIHLRICGSEHISGRLEKSLISAFEHKIVSCGQFAIAELEREAVAFSQNGWDKNKMSRILSDFCWYVQDNFSERMLFVLQDGCQDMSELVAQIRNARRLSRSEGMFREGVLMLNADGTPILPELDTSVVKLRECAMFQRDNEQLRQCILDLEQLPSQMKSGWKNASVKAECILNRLGADENAEDCSEFLRNLEQRAAMLHDDMRHRVNPQILEAIDCMNAHLSEKIYAHELSCIIGYHPAYFSNLFKHEVGIGYSEFLTELRINRAKELMRETNASLQDIAEQCGFPDLPYFSQKFKRAEGMTPSQWRAKR